MVNEREFNYRTVLIVLIIILLAVKVVTILHNYKKAPSYDAPTTENFTGVEVRSAREATKFGKIVVDSDYASDSMYNFSLIYVVLYDKRTKNFVDSAAWETRLSMYGLTLYRESFGRIFPETKLYFLDVNELGDRKLDYNKRSVFEWVDVLEEYFDDYEYNILAFSPIDYIDWCTDSHSIGYNYHGKIFLCQEFFEPYSEEQNKVAVGLLIHKIMHGLGYNHIDETNKQFVFINWILGLPESNGLPHGSFSDFPGFFFEEHFYKTMGLLEKETYEKNCFDSDSFVCRKISNFDCRDSWGDFCTDADNDNIRDDLDDYIFFPGLNDEDSDKDGIPDTLDLCPEDEISLTASNVDFKKHKLQSVGNTAKIQFHSNITRIDAIPFSMVDGFIRFLNSDRESGFQNPVELTGNPPLWKLEVFYTYENREWYRPFYLYFPGMSVNILDEREWYFFNRFGCGIPADIDLSNYNTFDRDLDGLPDAELFDFANKIDASYDWDGDGIPDIEDTLPTVTGYCSNEYVSGVKDSDGDGLCDPGRFIFKPGSLDKYHEIKMGAGLNPEYDACPFLDGSKGLRGCPDPDGDGIYWYSDPCPIDNKVCFNISKIIY